MNDENGTTVVEILREDQLAEIAAEWCALWQRVPSASPFQSPAWLLPWWRHFGSGRLRTLAARRRDELVGILPVYSPPDDPETLLFLGTGTSDYLDAVLDPFYEMDALGAMLRHLDGQLPSWRVLDLQQLRPGSALLKARAPAGWTSRVEPQDVCPCVSLGDCDSELHGAVPSHFLEKLSYYERRTRREDKVSFIEGTGDLIETLIQLHTKRWEEQDEPGVLAGEGVQAFQRDVVERFRQAGMLRLHGMQLGGRVVAVYYGFFAKGHAYYYLGAFDPELSVLSLGHQIVYHAMREAKREGAHTFDFLRGSEPYKYEWGATDRTNSRRVCRSQSDAT